MSALKIVEYQTLLDRLRTFIAESYVPDVLAVAGAFPEYFQLGRSCGNFLAYGVFPEPEGGERFLPAGVLLGGTRQELNPDAITEDVRHSLFSSASGRKPFEGETEPAPSKEGAYSWLKAPRYEGHVMEVGPLARLLVAYQEGRHAAVKGAVDALLKALNREPKDLASAMGRHAARALECQLVADRCLDWLAGLKPDEPARTQFRIPETGRGVGLTEAARGALGHWLELGGRKIARYQCVVPTTWNCSPRDDRGTPGAIEQALVSTPVADVQNPIEVARVVRSFDPCIACAVH